MLLRVMPLRTLLSFGVLLFCSTSMLQAQRPSLGSLQVQINEMQTGDSFFDILAFGDECRFTIDPELTGLIEEDPFGLRLAGNLRGGGNSGCRLTFGLTDECLIEVRPEGPRGLILQDPFGLRLLPPPVPPGTPIPLPPPIIFGPTDECRILIDPDGMVFSDPGRFCFKNPIGIPEVEIPLGLVEFGDGCTIGIDPELQHLLLSDIRVSFESPLGPGEGDFEVDGLITGAEFAQRSSRELKKNIRTIDNPLEKVKKLRGVYFDWRGKKDDATELGFIAEEVAEVVEEAAVYNKEDETKVEAVKYSNLVALAMEGIKAQQKQIEAQQEMIEQLQQEVAALRAE